MYVKMAERGSTASQQHSSSVGESKWTSSRFLPTSKGSATRGLYTSIDDQPAKNNLTSIYNKLKRPWGRGAVVCSIVASMIGIVALWTLQARHGTRTLRMHAQPVLFRGRYEHVESTEGNGLGIAVYNEYTRNSPIEYYPWEHMAEPCRPTTLQVVRIPKLGEKARFRWEVDGVVVGYGLSVETIFRTPGTYKCSVTALDESLLEEGKNRYGHSTSASIREFSVSVKYVRREIRDLTDRDREAFFNAISVMQRVPSVVGQILFGNTYYSKDYFNRLHMYYGSGRDCDHWHEGAGFVTAHVSLILMYEQSLQAVNPIVSLPYWDFTIEGTLFDPDTFRYSSVFADDWLGTALPEMAFRTPDRGRFAYVPVMTNASFFSSVTNPYGLLRSPWNSDNNPFMTRHDTLFGFENDLKPSGCEEYRDTLRKKNWMALSTALNTEAHGHIHELMGGTWSKECGEIAYDHTINFLPFLHTVQPYTKDLWRAGFYDCPQQCQADVPWRECQCTCKEDRMAGKTPTDILKEAGILESAFFYDQYGRLIDSFVDDQGVIYYTIPGHSLLETKQIYSDLLTILCTPARVGTNYEASSTNDPIFWVMHPTIDRAWQYSRLGNLDFDHTWVADHICYGHNPDDIQPFHDLFTSGKDKTDPGRAPMRQPLRTTIGRIDRAPDWPSSTTTSEIPSHEELTADIEVKDKERERFEQATTSTLIPLSLKHGWELKERLAEVAPLKEYYSNKDLYELLRPDRDDLGYVYGNFEWPHCDEQGIYMFDDQD